MANGKQLQVDNTKIPAERSKFDFPSLMISIISDIHSKPESIAIVSNILFFIFYNIGE